jgi:hypothetical protein
MIPLLTIVVQKQASKQPTILRQTNVAGSHRQDVTFSL